MKKKLKFVFALDGTLCEELPTFEKSMAKPIRKAIDLVNDAYDAGHQITIYTARGWAEYAMTKQWLADNGVLHHLLMCGKVHYDFWVDDKAHRLKNVASVDYITFFDYEKDDY